MVEPLAILILLAVAVEPAQTAEPQVSPMQQAADEAYAALTEAYLTSDWDVIEKQEVAIRRHLRFLTPQQRQDVTYIRKHHKDFAPNWWRACSSVSATQFPAEIWGRKFVANYEPGQGLGVQRVHGLGEYVRTRRGYEYKITGLKVVVMWRPGMVDDPNPLPGNLSERMGYTRGDLAEVIVWHELGHNYLTNALKVAHVVDLYENHQVLYAHLQEFYADLTSLYHCSPRSVRAACQFRLQGLDYYDDDEEHNRGAHAIGSMLLMEMLNAPEAWPSVHFPPSVPAKQVELNTIIYVYEHWDPRWTVAETRRLREFVGASAISSPRRLATQASRLA